MMREISLENLLKSISLMKVTASFMLFGKKGCDNSCVESTSAKFSKYIFVRKRNGNLVHKDAIPKTVT